MKRLKNALILLSALLFVSLIVTDKIKFDCLLKRIIKINCPSCGLTRSFKSILKLDFVSSIKYNILGIPIFILGIIVTISLIKDIIKNEDKTIKNIFLILEKYNKVILIIIFITLLINNI